MATYPCKLKKFIHKIANLGIDKDTPFYVSNKIKLFNNANLVILLVNVVYLAIGTAFCFHWATALTAYSFVSNIVAFFLVKHGRYKLAFNFTMIYGVVFLTCFTFLFGNVNNSYFYFLFLPVVCNLMFDNLKTGLTYFIISLVFMIANIYIIGNYEPYYKLTGDLRFIGYPNVIFSALLIFLGVRLFKQENVKYAGEIETQRKVLEEKNTEITDSINYAKKIQQALLPGEDEFKTHFQEAFVLLKPKDIVSGDFYWMTEKSSKLFYATADCTGHGVPGGFMTMLGISFLDEIVNEKGVLEPAQILNELRERIIVALKQTGISGESKDGMDIALCCIDKKKNILQYAAANNSIYIIKDEKITEYKPDKQPCGFSHETKSFTQHEIKIEQGDSIYSFTDGFADQFGGPKGKKFKYRQLEDLLLSNYSLTAGEQSNILANTFDKWKGELEQVDDVLIIGVKI
jgi:sigma-B regulation protein RsbU (phosphoserine phosphatase)